MFFQDIKSHITCLAVIIVIFVVDINLSLGVAAGVPYLLVILISLWSTKQSSVIYFAIICSIMVVLGYYLSPEGGEDWKVLFNRALAIFSVWVTAILVFKWKAQSKAMREITNRVTKEKEGVYLATISSAQHIINNLLNQLQYIKIVIDESPEFDKKDVELLDEILEESSLLMHKLSSVKIINEASIKSSVHPANRHLKN